MSGSSARSFILTVICENKVIVGTETVVSQLIICFSFACSSTDHGELYRQSCVLLCSPLNTYFCNLRNITCLLNGSS